jgi:hypothetical protein
VKKRLKIAVNTRFLIADKLEGIGLFTLETLKEMVVQHPEVDFVFLFDRPIDRQFIFAQNIIGVSLSPPGLNGRSSKGFPRMRLICFYRWMVIRC